jgi:Gpi18-like mannosyltransferase
LLLLLLGECRWRFVAAAAYWLNPLSIIFSAYHGNTDSAVAFFLMLCVWFLSKDRLLGAAFALGVSFWIKLPTVLAIPAFLIAISNWRKRFQFLLITGAVGIATYIPALIQDPMIIWNNVFGYRAQIVHTAAGVPAWGPRILLFSVIASPQKWPVSLRSPIVSLLANGWLIALALALLVIWLRRSASKISELCATIAGVYIIILALSDGFSFQYFAWSLPFWFFLPRWLFIPVIVLVSAYVYFLYAYLCGNSWLLGFWDFNGHPSWPFPIIVIRNVAYLLFCAGAIWFVIAAMSTRRQQRLLPT